MNETTLEEVSRIMDDFDLYDIRDILSEQIENSSGDYTSPVIDHFQPIYKSYLALNELKDQDQEDVEILRQRFYQICNMIINLITKKFNIDIDDEYLSSTKDLAGLCLAMYSFFVIDFYENVKEIAKNYEEIDKDLLDEEAINENFKEILINCCNKKN